MRFDFRNVVPADHKIMRLINRANVLNIIREKAPISRVEISKITGLKKSTISSIVNDLISEDLVYEDSFGESSIGRKPIILRLKEKSRAIGVIDVRHVKTMVAICDLGCNILQYKELPTSQGNNRGEEFFSELGSVIARMTEEVGIPLAGVGVSAPSMASHKDALIYLDRTHHWQNLPVRKLVAEHVKCPVFADNDGKAAALGALWFAPEAQDASSFVFIHVCEGIGVGLVIDHSVYHGAYSLDGHFGQSLIKMDGRWEEINQDNTWEDNASDLGAVKRYGEYSGKSWTGQVHEIEAQMEKVIELARQNDTYAVRALQETARYLGVGIANINCGLGPEKFLVSGRMVKVWDICGPELIRQVERQTYVRVKPIELLILPSHMPNPTLRGAQALVLHDIFRSYRLA